MASETAPSETLHSPTVGKPVSGQIGNDVNDNVVVGESIEDSVESGYAGSVSSGSLPSLAETPSSAGPTEEERKAWADEMAKIEEEAATLRLVLQAKVRRATDLKRKLGITQVDELKAEFNSAFKTIQESNAYAVTSATFQVVGQKTSEMVSSAVGAFKGALNESAADPGPEKVSNTIFRDTSARISSAVNSTGTYVSQTVESVKNKPAVQAVGASITSSWTTLKGRVVGGGADARNNDSFLGDVVANESTTQ